MRSIILQFSQRTGWDHPFPKEMDSPRTLILIFGDSEFTGLKQAVTDLYRTFPKSHLTGCSTAGEIYGSRVFENTLTVGIIQFEYTDIRVEVEEIRESSLSFKMAETLAKRMVAPELKGLLVFSDGVHVNGTELLRGIDAVISKDTVIAGGLAGDGPRFQKTWIIDKGEFAYQKIAIVGLYGSNLQISAASLGGWDAFGPERLVTRSVNNVLFELDGIPALKLYKEYLGDRASELPSSALLFPLSIRSEVLGREGLVRTILSVDDKDNSMTFAGDIPTGSHARLMKANFSRLIEGASGAAKLVSKDFSGTSESLALAISCVGRKLVLGTRTEAETEATLAVLPKNTKQLGFYSYGEISPLANGKCDLHNQTMTITLISEKKS